MPTVFNLENNQCEGYSVPNIKKIFVSEWTDELDWNYESVPLLSTQSLKISEYIKANIVWYHIPIDEVNVSFNQTLDKVRQGFIYNDELTIAIPKNNTSKWNKLTSILKNRYVVIFQDANDNWWTFGYKHGAETTNYDFDSTIGGFKFSFKAVSENKIITAMNGDYIFNLNLFVSTWDTRNIQTNSSTANQISLPLVSGGTYNFIVDWGDGNTDIITGFTQTETTHTYFTQDIYDVTISGTCEGWRHFDSAYADNLKILNISAWGDLKMLDDPIAFYFYNCNNLTITANDILDVSSTTSLRSMFRRCTSLTSIDVSNWNTSNVTTIFSIFEDSNVLEKVIGLETWNTNNFVNISRIFNDCASLTSINISNWNTSNVTTMGSIFLHCTSLTSINISNWNTSNVINIENLINGCTSLTSINISNWDVSSVTNMQSAFRGCTSLTSLDVSTLNVSSVTNMQSAFRGSNLFTTLDVSNWNVSSVTNMSYLFDTCTSLTSIDVSNWNTNNLIYSNNMFDNCTSLTTLDVSNFNMSSVITTDSMFFNCNLLTTLDVSNWNVSNIQFMGSTFALCSLLTTLDVSAWTISSCTSMGFIFNNVPLSTASYDGLLNNNTGWISRGVQTNVNFGANLAKYTSGSLAETGRTNLINTHSWIITDAGPV